MSENERLTNGDGKTESGIGITNTNKLMLPRPTIEAFDRHLVGLGLRFEVERSIEGQVLQLLARRLGHGV